MKEVKPYRIQYFQSSFETKINLFDAYLSSLAEKYVTQKVKKGDRESLKDAVNFSREIYEGQNVLNEFRAIFLKAETDVNRLHLSNLELLKRINMYEATENVLDEVKRAEINKRFEDEIKDKYQIEIQRLEIENDKLTKALTNRVNNLK